MAVTEIHKDQMSAGAGFAALQTRGVRHWQRNFAGVADCASAHLSASGDWFV
jgi:hypothetical protein